MVVGESTVSLPSETSLDGEGGKILLTSWTRNGTTSPEQERDLDKGVQIVPPSRLDPERLWVCIGVLD